MLFIIWVFVVPPILYPEGFQPKPVLASERGLARICLEHAGRLGAWSTAGKSKSDGPGGRAGKETGTGDPQPRTQANGLSAGCVRQLMVDSSWLIDQAGRLGAAGLVGSMCLFARHRPRSAILRCRMGSLGTAPGAGGELVASGGSGGEPYRGFIRFLVSGEVD
jgi:hypothetical protein